jgi:hypothetical protein
MSADISLFSGYNQRENRHTNYCLLMLRLLYEENPKYLEEALDSITGGQMGTIGVEFKQQERKASGIPDGVIHQAPFHIFIETKNMDWFHDDQLERHLHDLNEESSGQKILLALSKFEEGYEGRFDHIEHLCEEKYGGNIAFAALSFEEFLEAIRIDGLPKNISDQVGELEAYFDQHNLLPNWKYTLDVCNCVRTMHEHTEHGVYICPAKGGAYSHKRARFFGAYKNKQAQYIAEIAGVVDVSPGPDGDTEVLWNNSDQPPASIQSYTKAQLAQEARQRKMAARPNISWTARVFVLEDLTRSSFQKSSKGGMRGSKQYFDVSSVDANSAGELANALEGETWDKFA